MCIRDRFEAAVYFIPELQAAKQIPITRTRNPEYNNECIFFINLAWEFVSIAAKIYPKISAIEPE